MPSLLPMMLAAPTTTPPQSAAAVTRRFLAVETEAWPALYEELKAQGTVSSYLESGYRSAVAIRKVTDAPWFKVHSWLRIAATIAAGYHGVRRNNGSLGWGLWWTAMGSLFPVTTTVFSVAQGWAKEK